MSKAITTNVVVNAPVEEVWETLIDLPGYRQWNPFITSGAGTITPGTQLTVTIHPPGGRAMTFKPKVTAVQQHHRFEWLGRLGVPGIFDGRHSFTLTSMPGGRTLVQQSETFTGVLVPFTDAMLDRTRTGFLSLNEALAQRFSQSDTGKAAR